MVLSTLFYRERKLEEENSLFSKQLSILQQQLRDRSEELLKIRNENSSSTLNMQSKINHLSQEVCH